MFAKARITTKYVYQLFWQKQVFLYSQNVLFFKKKYFFPSFLASKMFIFLAYSIFFRLQFTGKVKWLQFQYEVGFGDSFTGGTVLGGLFKLALGISTQDQICHMSYSFTLCLFVIRLHKNKYLGLLILLDW